MREKRPEYFVLEPERYELASPPTYHFELDRREFLRRAGAGVAVFCLLPRAAAQEAGRSRRGFAEREPQEIGAWIHIGESGAVTVYTGKAEVGQDIRTSLTQAVAEELRVPPGSIRMVMGDTDLTPYDMGTFGSRTTPSMAPQLRRAAAAARHLMIELAAKRWNTSSVRLVAAEGEVRDGESGRSVKYAELALGQALARAVMADEALTPAASWRVAGRPLAKVDGVEFVTGRHQFTPDVKRPGMLHGKVLRPPALGSTPASIETSAAEKLAGVTVVRDGDFVGVTAPSASQAARALAAIRAEWKPVEQISNRELFAHLKAHAETSERSRHVAGSVESALAAADERLETTYEIAYIAHAPLEPRAAVAEWQEGRLTVWTGTQRPFGVRSELAEAFRLGEERVRVIVPDTGSAYGGKHTGEAAVEAARLAKAAGRPVKLVWTREEEFMWAYFRPAGVMEVRSGATKDGRLTAWEFHNYNSGTAALRTPYDVENQRVEFHPTRSPLRQGSYRVLAATANNFARESHMDELARRLGTDPLEFRLKNLKDARLRAVLEAAAEKFGWGRATRSPGRGFGIAGGTEKNSYVATCAEVSVDARDRRVRVERVVAAFECGAVVNPDGLENQVVGCLIMALGGALFEKIDFADGRILNGRFSDYRVPRISDVPPIDVVLLDRKDLASAGAGETPMIGLAPAIANAIFDASGVRLRALPLVPTSALQKSGSLG